MPTDFCVQLFATDTSFCWVTGTHRRCGSLEDAEAVARLLWPPERYATRIVDGDLLRGSGEVSVLKVIRAPTPREMMDARAYDALVDTIAERLGVDVSEDPNTLLAHLPAAPPAEGQMLLFVSVHKPLFTEGDLLRVRNGDGEMVVQVHRRHVVGVFPASPGVDTAADVEWEWLTVVQAGFDRKGTPIRPGTPASYSGVPGNGRMARAERILDWSAPIVTADTPENLEARERAWDLVQAGSPS